MRRGKAHFKMVLWWGILFALSLGCGLFQDLVAPFFPTPTPSPTPTFTPTPTPSWNLSAKVMAPSGRRFEFGSLSPDGRYILLSTQPLSSTEATGSPYLTLLDAETLTPIWEGPPPTQNTFAWLENAIWFPSQDVMALLGVSPESAVLFLLRISTGEHLAEMFFSRPYNPHIPLAGDGQDTLWVRERQGRFFIRYRIPQLNQEGTLQGSDDGTCCIFEGVALAPSGLAAIGWDVSARYNLVVWPTQGGVAQIHPLPYIYQEHTLLSLTWNDANELAAIVYPNTQEEEHAFVVWDASTGDERWKIPAKEFTVVLMEWLPGRGWLVAEAWGTVRLYSGAQTYEVLREARGSWLTALDASMDGNRLLVVTEARAERWDWK